MKSEIELRLQGHLLSDWCAQKTAQSEKFLYETGFDSTYRIIRFSTQTLDSLFTLPKTQDGHWKNGRAGMYEIQNITDGIVLSCTACPVGLNQRECSRMKRLAEICNAELENGSYRLVHWDLSDGNANINQVIEELNQVFNFELSYRRPIWAAISIHSPHTGRDALIIGKELQRVFQSTLPTRGETANAYNLSARKVVASAQHRLIFDSSLLFPAVQNWFLG